jgi:hypothetical protein
MNKIYIPLARDSITKKEQSVFSLARQSILSQTIPMEIVPCITDGDIDSQGKFTPERIIGEVNSRNLGIDKFLETEDKYFLMQCRDVKQLYPDNFEKMIAYMDNNLDCGACYLKCLQTTKQHFDIGTVCIRREVLEGENGVRFRNKYGKCLCVELQQDIVGNGYKIDYISDDILITKL